FANQVGRAAMPWRSEMDLPWIGLGIGDQLLNRLRRKRCIDDEYVLAPGNHRHRSKTPDRIIAEISVDRGSDGHRRSDDQQRVAIRVCTCGRPDADRTAGTAGTIVDDDWLAERDRQAIANNACNRI